MLSFSTRLTVVLFSCCSLLCAMREKSITTNVFSGSGSSTHHESPLSRKQQRKQRKQQAKQTQPEEEEKTKLENSFTRLSTQTSTDATETSNAPSSEASTLTAWAWITSWFGVKPQ